jgi:nucleotide-binding universal stress UspA family protein
MGMYDRILVPTDGSDAARAAAEEALALAAETGAKLLVVYVVDESAGNLFVSGKSVNDAIEAMSEQGRNAVAEIQSLADAFDGEIDIETDVVRGMHVHDAIVDYAKAHEADLVVMGTFGRRGVEHLLGSTTERVLARSSIPVLSVAVRNSDDE